MPDKTGVNLQDLDAVFFDLGMVLFRFDWRIAIPRFASLNGGDRARVEQFLADDLHVEYELGRLSDRTFYERACRQMRFCGTYAEFKDIWCDIFQEISGTSALARQIAQFLPVYAVSNTNPLHIEFLEANRDLFQIFRQRFYSYALGLRKPDAQLYREMLRRAQVEPSRALLVDDNLENVRGARAVEMQALHVPTPELAQAQLGLLLTGLQASRKYEPLAR